MASVVEFLLAGFTDNSGQPLAGGKVYAYEAGSGSTPAKDLYLDNLAATPATNPVILDANGRKQVYGDGAYKLVIKTSADALLYTLDNLFFGKSSGHVFIGTTSGSGNTYTANPANAVSSLEDGQLYVFQADKTNDDTATLNISGLGPHTVSTIAGQIVAGMTYVVRWKASTTVFQIVNPDPGYATTYSEMSALNALGVEIVVRQRIVLSNNLTLTAPLRIENGGMIETGSHTLTINGPFSCALRQCFDTQVSKVIFGNNVAEVYPQWFGAVPDGTTDCSDALNFSLASIAVEGGTVSLPTGDYACADIININGSSITLKGNNSSIICDAAQFGFEVDGTSSTQIENILIEDLKFFQLDTASVSGSQQAIQFNHVNKVRVKNCYVQDWAVGFKFNSNCQHIWVEDCYFDNIGEGGVGGIAIYVEGEDGAVGFSNDHVHILNNYVNGCIYGCEVKFVNSFVISGNIVENTTGDKYAILGIKDTGSGTEDRSHRGIISDNIVRNCTGEGIFAKGINIIVADNYVENTSNLGFHLAGANMVMTGNIGFECYAAASIVYDSDATVGAGSLSADVDSAKMIIANNLFMRVLGTDPGMSFNACSDSLISGNIIQDYKGTGGNAYGFKFSNCGNTRILDNYCYGGVFGYRIESSNANLTFRNNKSEGFSSAEVSLPSAQPGWSIEDGSYQGRYFVRHQTSGSTPEEMAPFDLSGISDCVGHFRAMVNVKSSSGVAVVAAYDIEVVVSRASGSLSVTGSSTTLFSAESNAALDCSWNVTGSTLRILVTGIAATTLTWEAVIDKVLNY